MFQTSVKLCDPDYSSNVAKKATGLLLPCLLHAGLGSSVQEVRAIRSVVHYSGYQTERESRDQM